LDVKDWLEIKPREKLLLELSKYAEFLKEENLEEDVMLVGIKN
jgi:hypothetical protein